MVEPSYPVAIVAGHAADLAELRYALASVGSVWLCMRAADLPSLVAERRIRLIIATPRDADGVPVSDALRTVGAQHAELKSILIYCATPRDLLDAGAVAAAGTCVAHLLRPVANLAGAARAVLAARWRRGPERTLVRGLLGPWIGSAAPFAILSLLRPSAAAGVRDICELCGLSERRVERDFARSCPHLAAEARITPLRFCRLALALTVVWWLAHGHRVDGLVHQFGFVHRYALSALLTHYAGRPPGSVSRPRHFREVYARVLRRLPIR